MGNSSIKEAVIENLSTRLGASSETVQKLRFGRGAVGKIAVISVMAFAAIVAMSLRFGISGAYLGVGSVVVVALAGFWLIFYIVKERPELAVLEGSELVLYKHVTLGMKGNPSISIDSALKITPAASQNDLLESEADDGN